MVKNKGLVIYSFIAELTVSWPIEDHLKRNHYVDRHYREYNNILTLKPLPVDRV